MAQIEYDKEGGISLYFFAAFWGLVLFPLTYFYWPRKQKRTASAVPCKCKQCGVKAQALSKIDTASSFAKWGKRLVFILGWVIFVLLVLQASKVEKDYIDYDPFVILGVDRGASEAEIKKAYRKLTLIYHPDKEGGDETKFLQISKAHAALTDQEARENWEKYGNPDGPKAATFGIALPSWIVDKKNSIYVLGIYGFCFMIILPTVVSIWWYKSNKTAGESIQLSTSQLYHEFIHKTPAMSFKMVVKVLGTSFEFDKKHNPEMVFRSSDEHELKRVQRELPAGYEDKKNANKLFCYPHSVKARTIVNAHLHRIPLTTNLEADKQYVLKKTPMLVQEMVNIFVRLLFLHLQRRVPNRVKTPSLECMIRLHQSLIQGVGESESRGQLLQLPHLQEGQLKALNTRKREVKSLIQLAKMSHKEREHMLNFLEQQEYQDMMNVLGMLPVIKVEVEIQVIDDNDQRDITAKSIVTVKCKLTRENFRSVYFNSTPDIEKQSESANGYLNGTGNGSAITEAPEFSCEALVKQNQVVTKRKNAKKQVRGGKKHREAQMQRQKLSENSGNNEDAANTTDNPGNELVSLENDGGGAANDEDGLQAVEELGETEEKEEEKEEESQQDSDDEMWNVVPDPVQKRREILDVKPKISHEVHCPYFPEIWHENWWVYLYDPKIQMLKSPVEKVSGLKYEDTVNLQFTAPDEGSYSYVVCVRSDSYVGLDVEKEFKISVQPEKVIEDHPQWRFSDDEKEDEDKEAESDNQSESEDNATASASSYEDDSDE